MDIDKVTNLKTAETKEPRPVDRGWSHTFETVAAWLILSALVAYLATIWTS
jgi:hypothetical protein